MVAKYLHGRHVVQLLASKYNTCFIVSVLDGNMYYLCVCNKGDKIWYIFINLTKQKTPLNSVSAEILLHKKNVEAFHPTLENIYYLLLKSF